MKTCERHFANFWRFVSRSLNKRGASPKYARRSHAYRLAARAACVLAAVAAAASSQHNSRLEMFATFKSKINGGVKNACVHAIFNHDVSLAWQINVAFFFITSFSLKTEKV